MLLLLASHFNWSINSALMTQIAFGWREKNRELKGRGEWKSDFRDGTGSHVVFPLEDPLLPVFCWSPAPALIWSLLRVEYMLRHYWNCAVLSSSQPPPSHLLFTLFLFSVHLAVFLWTVLYNCLFFCTASPALYIINIFWIVLLLEILMFYLI